ncbi:MAG: DUF494 family protein [Bdellovibrionota bacterium]
MDEKLQGRIREVVGVIGRFLSENQIDFDEENLQYELENLGFNAKEIAGAYRFIEKSTLGPQWRKRSNKSAQKKSRNRNKTMSGVRVLSDIEAAKIDNKAHAYLLQLLSVGAINLEMMEEIIEHALGHNDEYISVAEIRRLTALLLFTRVQISQGEGSLSVSNTLIH